MGSPLRLQLLPPYSSGHFLAPPCQVEVGLEVLEDCHEGPATFDVRSAAATTRWSRALPSSGSRERGRTSTLRRSPALLPVRRSNWMRARWRGMRHT